MDLYLRAEGKGEEEGLAIALAVGATKDNFDDLVALLGDETRGSSRIHLLRAVKRVGRQRGREVLERLASDPLFGREATHLIRPRR